MKKLIAAFGCLVSLFANAYDSQAMISGSADKGISVSNVSDELSIPWAMVQLPSGEILITERSGKLRVIKQGKLLAKNISGLPNIHAKGQGGLLDIALHPEFSENHWLYFTYASKQGKGRGGNTALMRAKLNIDTLSLSDQQVLYKASPNTQGGRHFGSRIVFDHRGDVYFSIGDRGQRDSLPQDLTKDGGKIYRLHDDGTIPTDNPFYGKSGLKQAVFSYGHRNPQGLAVDPNTLLVWSNEHGPRGGDEVNVLKKGANYGWPVISYGINYSGTSFTDKTSAPDMEQPALYWDPSIAPSDMIFVSSERYPKFQGKFLVGSLKFNHLVLLSIDGDKVTRQEKVFADIGRARSLMQGNDGYIYVGIDGEGIKKLSPAK